MSASKFLIACFFAVATTVDAQVASVSGTFVSMLGSDTVAIERYTRTANRLEGDILSRYPQVQVIHYVADLSAGRFRGMSVSTRRPGADPTAPPASSAVTLIRDSTATIEIQRGGRPDTVSSRTRAFSGLAVPGVPTFPAAAGLYEQILQLHSPLSDSLKLSTPGAAFGDNSTISLFRRSRDTVVFASSYPGGWIEIATVDAEGKINAIDATATTIKTRTHRASGIDFDARVQSWAAAETARGRAGRMSPRDTVKAQIGTAAVEVVYSRPSKRGREIWGNIVKWGEPWRTGADGATGFTTTAELVFGTTVIPAGKYTLWSLPTATGTKLIINLQTGQWGTQYDAARDVVRLDMMQSALAQPVEQFTISVLSSGTGGVLKLAWDNREYSIPFRAR